MELICKNCGKLFYNKHKEQKYCSRECFSIDKQNSKRNIKCLECGKDIKLAKNERNKIFCSQECYFKNKGKKPINLCPICGNETKNNIYCSKKCYGISKTKNKTNNKICKHCNNPYYTTNHKSEYCSIKCYWEFRKNNSEIIFQSNQGINLITKKCNYCDKEYYIHPYREQQSHYCSNECHIQDHHIIKTCPTCGEDFDVAKWESDKIYCSNYCVVITRDSHSEREIKLYLSKYFEIKKTNIRLENRSIRPDIIINNKIIEFYGDYWHCNPIKYDKSYYHKQIGKYAEDIWKYDNERINILQNNGYVVLIIWENSYIKNKDDVYKKINEFYEIC